MDEYIKKSEAVDVIVKNPYNIAGKTATAIKMIEDLPSAEVVPKSEEGAECPTCHGTGRIGTTDWLTKNISKEQIAKEKAEAIAEHEQHIKQDYATEIFAEIEKIINDDLINRKLAERGLSLICKIGETTLESQLAELKKKYTECEDKPAATEEKYFSPEDVRKMTNQEVREKYTAIRRSMERW